MYDMASEPKRSHNFSAKYPLVFTEPFDPDRAVVKFGCGYVLTEPGVAWWGPEVFPFTIGGFGPSLVVQHKTGYPSSTLTFTLRVYNEMGTITVPLASNVVYFGTKLWFDFYLDFSTGKIFTCVRAAATEPVVYREAFSGEQTRLKPPSTWGQLSVAQGMPTASRWDVSDLHIISRGQGDSYYSVFDANVELAKVKAATTKTTTLEVFDFPIMVPSIDAVRVRFKLEASAVLLDPVTGTLPTANLKASLFTFRNTTGLPFMHASIQVVSGKKSIVLATRTSTGLLYECIDNDPLGGYCEFVLDGAHRKLRFANKKVATTSSPAISFTVAPTLAQPPVENTIPALSGDIVLPTIGSTFSIATLLTGTDNATLRAGSFAVSDLIIDAESPVGFKYVEINVGGGCTIS